MKDRSRLSKGLRPTTGKVKEALFNILRSRIDEARFLDLYAGTGAVGIEALRQGAKEVIFVEASRSNAKSINDAIEKYHFSEKATVINKKVLTFLMHGELTENMFDIIFLDPPYHTDEILEAMAAIEESNILNDSGVVVAEHFAKKQLPERFKRLLRVRDYRYGDTVLSLYEKREPLV